jgi:hypothetical protein
LESRTLERAPSQLRCNQRSTTNTVQHHKDHYNPDRFNTSPSSKDLWGVSLLYRLEHHDVNLSRLLQAWCNLSLKLLRSQLSQGDLDTNMSSFIESPHSGASWRPSLALSSRVDDQTYLVAAASAQACTEASTSGDQRTILCSNTLH